MKNEACLLRAEWLFASKTVRARAQGLLIHYEDWILKNNFAEICRITTVAVQ
ncbi:hypothetical protein CEXT_808741, partial [Caerostris extrusa]